jgi:hypothetical protein
MSLKRQRARALRFDASEWTTRIGHQIKTPLSAVMVLLVSDDEEVGSALQVGHELSGEQIRYLARALRHCAAQLEKDGRAWDALVLDGRLPK